jgi:hypothetical protein
MRHDRIRSVRFGLGLLQRGNLRLFPLSRLLARTLAPFRPPLGRGLGDAADHDGGSYNAMASG